MGKRTEKRETNKGKRLVISKKILTNIESREGRNRQPEKQDKRTYLVRGNEIAMHLPFQSVVGTVRG